MDSHRGVAYLYYNMDKKELIEDNTSGNTVQFKSHNFDIYTKKLKKGKNLILQLVVYML